MILRSQIKIREASASDINELVPLLKELFLIETDFNFNEKRHQRALEALIKSSEATVVCVSFDQKIIAMMSLQNLISTVSGNRVGLVEDFIISEPYRGMGIGSYMFKYIKNLAKELGMNRLQLVCDDRNESAKQFYLQKAFEQSNLSAWYYTME